MDRALSPTSWKETYQRVYSYVFKPLSTEADDEFISAEFEMQTHSAGRVQRTDGHTPRWTEWEQSLQKTELEVRSQVFPGAQWLTVHLPMQDTGSIPDSRKSPHAGTTKSVHHNCWACTQGHALQQGKPPGGEAVHCTSPHLPTKAKPTCSRKTHCGQN